MSVAGRSTLQHPLDCQAKYSTFGDQASSPSFMIYLLGNRRYCRRRLHTQHFCSLYPQNSFRHFLIKESSLVADDL